MGRKDLEISTLENFHQAFTSSPKNLMARNAVTRSSILDVAMNREAATRAHHTFSNVVTPHVTVTNQKASGRCWLFAALNAMRIPLMRKYKLDKFEFSQAYLFFYDKLEKANFFLENILKTAKEDLDSRLVQHLLWHPVEDGGQWHMFVNLVSKYGIVPQEAMPESFHSGASARLNWILTYKLREFAKQLRDGYAAGQSPSKLRAEKTEMLEDVYRILTIHLGSPPTRFDWRFRDKKKKFHEHNDITPQEFFKKFVPFKVNDKICLINAPSPQKPLDRLYTVDYLGNVAEGLPVLYINLPIEELRKATIRSLKANDAVWFGCDVGQHFSRDLGFLDPELYNYELVFDTSFQLDKGHRIDYRESLMTHAMVFSGVDLHKGKPQHWRVENSWGDQHGQKGFFSMSDAWFDEFVFEVTIDKKFLPKRVLSILEQKPLHLPPWDPMGSLA
ncbi:MAG: C1 family peptidase [Chlamydiia bacterium]|nr:C1 family peptidase [Chlamydiia bacterium]